MIDVMTSERTCDVIVIGGGPAGAAAAMLVAEKNHRVLLLEREQFPRFKIGESLMPGTYWTLKRLGVLESMERSFFPRKLSVQFFSKSGKPSAPFYFFEKDPHESSKTWQVLRSEFDRMVLDNAEKKGVSVHHGVRVADVVFENQKSVGVIARMPDESVREYRAKVIVDASGQNALIARKLKISRTEPHLRKASIFTHFRGGIRGEGIDEGATIIFHTRNGDSWFWSIPLPDDVVSVGVVGSIDYLLQNRNSTPQRILEDELRICPALGARLSGAKQLFPAKTSKDFSYRASQVAGDGWVLVGDAFGFLDPIYSSGVFLALKSGELAADAINEAFERNDFSANQLGKFAPDLLKGMESIRKLVYAFYSPDFSFATFLKRFPERKNEIVDILIGNVFTGNIDGLFDDMGEMCEFPQLPGSYLPSSPDTTAG